ncbi:MAG: diguanylate cyclase [bacterium]
MSHLETNGFTELLMKAVVGSHSIVVITDPQCVIVYVNDMFCNVAGYTRDESIGRHVGMLKSGQMKPEFYTELWERLNSSGQWRGELRVRKKSGDIYIEEATISAIRGSGGEVEHYVKVAADITAYRALAERLGSSQERYERLVRALHGFAFTVFLENGRPLRTLHYPGTEDVTGYTPDEYGKSPELWYSMIVEEDRSVVTSQIEFVQREKKQHAVEHRIRHKNGAIRWVRNVSVPTVGQDQQVVCYDGLITDITELKEAEAHRDRLMEEMRHAAVRDPLTGLFSRRVFDEELDRARRLSESKGLPLGIMIMDVDHFKLFNDTFGHQVGDQILVESARLTAGTVRAGDIVCRYGGDEIVVILPQTGLDETQRVGARLLDAFRRHTFCRNNFDLRATVSIGAAAGLESACPVSEILLQADHGLYHAKHMGRNMMCFFEPDAASFVVVGNTPQCEVSASAVNVCHNKGRILLVDGDASSRQATYSMLERELYSVTVANDVDQAALAADAAPDRIDVVLLDERFVASNDGEVLRRLRMRDETVQVVIMAGPAGLAGATSMAHEGVAGYAKKPVSIVALVPILEGAILQKKTLKDTRRRQQAYGDMVAERTAALTRLIGSAKRSYMSMVTLLATIFEVYDRREAEHCKRVERMADILAHEMQMAGEDVEMLSCASSLHDIGKIGISEAILRKHGPLTIDEWAVMKLHTRIGHDILRGCEPLVKVAGIILEHHERFDGSGYPCGLRGLQICEGARIIAVADSYDTIRSSQPYSSGRSVDEAITEILRCRGVLFDPGVVDGFLRCQTRIEACVSGDKESCMIQA